MNRQQFEAAVGRPVESKQRYITDLGLALDTGSGWATGKAGVSERAYLRRSLLPRTASRTALSAFDRLLAFRGLHMCGVFPAGSDFLERWCAHYLAAVKELDWLGVSGNGLPETAQVVTGHDIRADLLDHRDQQPDRSIPVDLSRCWLPHLHDRRVLLICPFASVLRDRARADVYEAVWASTGRRWFEPRSVDAIDIPYGIEPATWSRYDDCIELEHQIADEMDSLDYDVALIAAGGLGIPLAVHAKQRGRVGISLGGHLQLVFGVYGERWLARPHYRELYFNDAWIRVPAPYVPSASARRPVEQSIENEMYR
jgi:hypothetical protein